eukprot:scaffold1860_cov403-Prasinococcus_capsulatus_cf.AAC.10
MAMGNYPFPSSYLTNNPSILMPPFPVRVACSYLADEFDLPQDGELLLSALSQATSVFNNASQALNCYSLPEDKSYDGIWDYQWCTECLCQETYFERNGVTDMFWPFAYNEAAIDAHCQQKYGVQQRRDLIAISYGTAVTAHPVLKMFCAGLVLSRI